MIKKIEKEGKKITIIGTAHISKKNAMQVKEIIEKELPDIVAIELDIERFRSMTSKDKKEAKLKDVFRAKKPFLFLVYYILGKTQQKMAARFGIKPGVEMMQAAVSAKNVNAKILLADRNAQFTINKLIKSLTFRDKLKLFFSGFNTKKELGKDFNVDSLLKDVESKKQSETVDKILKIFLKKHKTIKRVLIDERDKYMAFQIQQVLRKDEFNKIVIVVGAGHVPGLIKNLDNKKIDIKKIMNY
ncbi:MAG: TraB domain-containing protein [Candidatus ainarchaeum sp.]|nr:TraB domain-containing protein [Candidatus ainarchaeum sp.]MDD3975796.1 TraB domain-containing protein [Candidatus ainarchaeum sp.]